jgi:Glycosyl hydrolases family 16
MPPAQKNTFQFGFEDDSSSRYSQDEDEHAGLNPFHDDNVDEYDHDIPSSDANSPYLIPSSPTSTINRSPTFSTRSSLFEGKTSVYPAYAAAEAEPTYAYPDGDSVYDFRDHLTHEPPTSTRYTRPFKSRLNKTGVEKPWVKEKDRREKWVTIIPLIGMAIGVGVASYLAYSGWASVETHTYCLVYEDNFSEFNQQVWNHEVQTGGYGTGEFEWTTQDPANSFVTNNTLFIMPTLTDQFLTEDQVNNGYTLNLTQQGSCTSMDVNNCVVVSNSSAQTVINPVRSARLSTKGSKSIKYGKVEVVAKLPVGDWLWPAIWMMPVNDTYGVWPQSGEIDIMESRGNNLNYPQGGDDTFSSTLHWGT